MIESIAYEFRTETENSRNFLKKTSSQKRPRYNSVFHL